jgi:glycosyltransferase involved in cell wall biosynthesis
MKVGLDLLWLRPGISGGLETYARGLIGGLAKVDRTNSYVLFTSRENHETLPVLPANFELVRCEFPSGRRWISLAYEFGCLPWVAARHGIDLLHGPANFVPPIAAVPTVVTLHDLHFYAVPESIPFFRRKLFSYLARMSLAQSAAVITDSEYCRREMISRFGAQHRFVAIHLAPRVLANEFRSCWRELAKRLKIDSQFILALSHRHTHKNLARLLRAYNLLLAKGLRTTRLVIAGHLPTGADGLQRLANELGLSERVTFTGFVSDAELRSLLENAILFVMPSLYEGFGLPLLEAMDAGTPVACSNAAALPEVAGEGALLFDPFSVESIAEAIARLLEDPTLRRSLCAAGRANLARFSWEQTARQTIRVYEECLRA